MEKGAFEGKIRMSAIVEKKVFFDRKFAKFGKRGSDLPTLLSYLVSKEKLSDRLMLFSLLKFCFDRILN